MKTKAILATAIAFVRLSVAAQTAAPPVWTASDGRVTVAKFIELTEDAVLIEKDGTPFAVPLAMLAPESVELAKKMGAEAAAMEADLGAKVMTFCRSNLGKKVGEGHCAALASKALADAGAAGMARKHAPGPEDYVWGRQVALIEGLPKYVKGLEMLVRVKPGDMIQFRDARLEGVHHDGRRGTYWYRFEHHSAVVDQVDVAQGILKVFHQNSGGKQFVVQDTFHLTDLVKGWLRFYRPQASKK